MRKCIPLLALIIFLLSSCGDNKVVLFNDENLDNWDVYVDDDTPAEKVFWVKDGLLHTAGIPNGFVRTKEIYQNYKLHVEWRWTEEPKNSGVLLHTQGENMIWPLCIESQLKAGNAGDIVLIGKGSGVTVKGESHLIESEENRYAVIEKFKESSEKPAGEWNTYDIIANADSLVISVNGVLQNKAEKITLSSGNICLQSEGGPMEFRNIYLIPIEK